MSIISKVPKVNFRPKYLAEIYAANMNEAVPLLRLPSLVQDSRDTSDLYTKISKYLSNFKGPIGVIQSIEITSSRDNSFYRELKSSTYGRIKEVYPGLPEYSAHVKKIALYTEHLLDAFQACSNDVFNSDSSQDSLSASFNIYNQIAPLVIKIEMLENTPNQEGKDQSTSLILWDCWFKTSNIEFDITDTSNLAIVQEADIKFAWLIAK